MTMQYYIGSGAVGGGAQGACAPTSFPMGFEKKVFRYTTTFIRIVLYYNIPFVNEPESCLNSFYTTIKEDSKKNSQ